MSKISLYFQERPSKKKLVSSTKLMPNVKRHTSPKITQTAYLRRQDYPGLEFWMRRSWVQRSNPVWQLSVIFITTLKELSMNIHQYLANECILNLEDLKSLGIRVAFTAAVSNKGMSTGLSRVKKRPSRICVTSFHAHQTSVWFGFTQSEMIWMVHTSIPLIFLFQIIHHSWGFFYWNNSLLRYLQGLPGIYTSWTWEKEVHIQTNLSLFKPSSFLRSL